MIEQLEKRGYPYTINDTIGTFGNVGVGTTGTSASLYVNGNVGIGTTAPATGAKLEVVGYQAGSAGTAITTGNYDTFLGYNSAAGSATLTNATAIGAFSQVGCSNCLVLGSVNGINGATSSVNVGMGTTSPQGALHVVGQCVTGDTKLRRRRRKRRQTIDDGEIEDGNLKMDDGKWKDKNLSSTIYPQNTTINPLSSTVNDYIYDDVRIDQINPGDEVLSLNEVSGQFEYQAVEKLLDMGTKGVYELVTKSGKRIKTTGNHPYLVNLELRTWNLELGTWKEAGHRFCKYC